MQAQPQMPLGMSQIDTRNTPYPPTIFLPDVMRWGHHSTTPALFQRAPTSGRPGILWAPETWRETICPPRAASLWERWHLTSPISTYCRILMHSPKKGNFKGLSEFVRDLLSLPGHCIKSDPLCCRELLPGDMYINDSWCSFRVHVSCDS